VAVCSSCMSEIPSGEEVLVAGKNRRESNTILCVNCASTVEQVFEAETKNPNLPLAVLLGIVAAVAGGLIWYAIVALTNYQLGIAAVGIGYLVGLAVVFGAGKKRGPALQAVAVVITLVAMVVGEYFVVRHFAVKAFAEEGISDIPVLLPLKTMFDWVIIGIKEDPITLLFWAIALFAAVSVPGRRRLRRVKA